MSKVRNSKRCVRKDVRIYVIMRIGILGGTFDPIHNGHLYLAKKVCQRLRLDRVIFIPAYLSPHKTDIKITAARDRYNMVRLAIADKRIFEISDIEVKKKGRSYSLETLKQLRKRYGFASEIFFITGSDSLRDIHKWKGLDTIARLCKFIVVKRPGFAIKNVPAGFMVIDVDARDISATAIRRMVGNNRSIRKLVPRRVADYIYAHRLYGKI